MPKNILKGQITWPQAHWNFQIGIFLTLECWSTYVSVIDRLNSTLTEPSLQDTCSCQGVRNVSCLGNFAYVLNDGWTCFAPEIPYKLQIKNFWTEADTKGVL